MALLGVWVVSCISCGTSLLQPQYLSLEELCQEFAVELLGMCRNQSEVTTILNSSGDESRDSLDEQTFEEGIPNLSRLRLAVNYNQKQVALDAETAVGNKQVKENSSIMSLFVFSVCCPPDLPAGAVIYLVWEPGGMARQQDVLEAVCICSDLSHYAHPLPRLLDRTKIKGHNP